MASRPYIYSGQGFSLQRDKNRFVLPAQFRAPLRESSEGNSVLYLAKHDRWKCLTGFGKSRTDEFEDMMDREESVALQGGRPYDREKRAHDLYNYFEVPFDASGRFVLPDDLATLGGVTDQLYFSGAGKSFTVWSPDALYAMDETWISPQTSCRNLAAKELAKAKRK